ADHSAGSGHSRAAGADSVRRLQLSPGRRRVAGYRHGPAGKEYSLAAVALRQPAGSAGLRDGVSVAGIGQPGDGAGLCRATACGLGAAPDYRGRSGDAVHQCDAAAVLPARLQEAAGKRLVALVGWVDGGGAGVEVNGGKYAGGEASGVGHVGGASGGGVFDYGSIAGAFCVAVEVATAAGAYLCSTG